MNKKPFPVAGLAAIICGLALTAAAFAADEHGHADHDDNPKPTGHDPHEGHAHGEQDGHEDHADEVKLTEEAIRSNGVKIGRAEKRQIRRSIVAPARLAYNAEAMAHVGAAVSGRVVQIKAKVGDEVHKGDELIVVESPELGRAQSEYLQKSVEAVVAAAAVEPTKNAFARAKKLFDESQGISLTEVQKREADLRAATGTAASTLGAMKAAENSLRLYGMSEPEIQSLKDSDEIRPQYSIRAPIAGRVIEREVTQGELISPDKDKLLVLADLSRVWVLADVAESLLSEISVGGEAAVQIGASTADLVQGKVSLISPDINPNTRTAQLRIEIDNKDGQLRPGMFARATLHGQAGEGVVAVPVEAVQTVAGKPSVFVPVAGEANTFARREITPGRADGGFVPVLKGLEANEPVVVAGAFILKAELGKSEAGHQH